MFFFALLKFVFFIGRLIDKNLSWKGLSCIILFGYMYLLLIFFGLKTNVFLVVSFFYTFGG